MKMMRSGQSGFTFLEVTLASTIALAALGAVVSLFGSTQNLTQDTRAHVRATSEHRRNLLSLSNLLRNVDIDTLEGFDESGIATEPTFQRVTGADLVDRSYAGVERLVWEPAPGAVWDIDRPGVVSLITPTEKRVVAVNVPAGGFSLRLEGRTLAVRLTTYYSLGDRNTAQVTSETAVSMRN